MLRGIFIDDKDSESQYAKHLTTGSGGEISFEFRRADTELTTLADEILAGNYGVLAVDYRLDENQIGTDPKNRYRAGALAQLVRERILDNPDSDLPVVLVSVEQNVRNYYRPDLTAHDLFDRVYTKDDVVRTTAPLQILSLANGYETFRRFIRKEMDLNEVLGLAPDERGFVSEDEIQDIATLAAPHQVAHCFFELFIDRTGKLLRENDLLARLGLALDTPDKDKLLEILSVSNVTYTGALSDGWPRWWEHRLRAWGRDVAGIELGDVPAMKRALILNEKFELQLKAAISRWTESSDALFAVACASCGSPTELQYAVPAYDNSRYKSVERKRICWACVESGDYQETRGKREPLRIDSGGKLIAEKIEGGLITREQKS